MTHGTRHFAIVASLLGTTSLTASAPIDPISIAPQSRLWVEGTSTVRAYTCKTTSLKGSITATSASPSLVLDQLEDAVRTVDLAISVGSLDCANGTMNGHLRNALKASEFPAVRFQLAQYDVLPSGASSGTIKLIGRLQIAGQERPVTIDAAVVTEGNGVVRVRGRKEILMSEYGVKPPSLMMGTMKVKDRVVVNFDVVLKQS